MEQTLEKLKFVATAVGTLFTYLLGGFDSTIIFLIIVMCCDYITGVIKGWFLQEVSSKTGFKGIVKKALIFIVLIIAVQLDNSVEVIDTPIFRTVVAWFFIANETISVFENCGAMGLKIPKILSDALIQIRDKMDSGEVNKIE